MLPLIIFKAVRNDHDGTAERCRVFNYIHGNVRIQALVEMKASFSGAPLFSRCEYGYTVLAVARVITVYLCFPREL